MWGDVEDLTVPLGLASESGVTDPSYVMDRADYIDAAFLGGLAVDDATRRAALRMIDRGRREFVYPDKEATELVRDWMDGLSGMDVFPAINVRATEFGRLMDVAEVVAEYDGVVEINAHCRQHEMTSLGCGHALLRDTEGLSDWVSRLTHLDIPVGAKIRANVVDEVEVAETIEDAGGSFIHIDCMDHPDAINRVSNATNLYIIANNGVRSRRDAERYLGRGADMVSTARGGRNPHLLEQIKEGDSPRDAGETPRRRK